MDERPPRLQSASTEQLPRHEDLREPLSLAPGDCLGRYTVRAAIGAGGMGEVYAAHDPVLDREVALKILKSLVAGGSVEARARFRREAQAMARLSHPNVVSVFDVGDANERVFVAMELVRGPTLGQWLALGARPVGEIIDVFLQAGRGLEAAHAAGIVHRDFKPGNVILGDRVRVVDFGLARATNDPAPESSPPPGSSTDTILHASVTRTGALLGTPAYMSPEQRLGGLPTAASDQYAFAVALHEALYGVRPGEPGVVRPVPRRLRALLARGLSEAPEDRYPSMTALLADLRRAQIRRRGIWIAAAAVLAASAAGVILLGRPLPPAQWSPVVIASQPAESGYFDYEVSRDGSTAAFNTENEIFVEPRQGGPRRRVSIPTGAGPFIDFRPGPDGKQIFLTTGLRDRSVTFWSVDVASGAQRRRFPPAGPDGLAVMSDWAVGPDESLLVIPVTADGGHAGIALVDPAGNARPIISLQSGELVHSIAFSFDGKRAVYSILDKGGRSAEVADLATGRRTRLPVGCNTVDWLGPDSVLCARASEGGFALEEIPLADGAAPRVRYQSPLYETLTALRTTTKGIFIVSSSMREHLAILDLESPGSGLRSVASGSSTDLFPAGWTPEGAILFGVEAREQLRMMSASDGGADFLVPGPDDGVPLAVVGRDLVFGRFPGIAHDLGRTNTFYGRAYPATGELFRRAPDGSVTALGTTRHFHSLRCAGDQAPPCLLLEGTLDDVQAVLIDPLTGERGAPLFHASLAKEGFHALSFDGKTIGRIVFGSDPGGGDVELVGIGGAGARKISWPGATGARYLAFERSGSLVAVGWSNASHSIIARLRESDPPVVLASQTRFVEEPRLSVDGAKLAVGTAELSQTLWWIDPK